MPEDLTWLDAAAFLAFLVIWFGYGALFDGRFRRPNRINEKMIGIREVWMMRLLDRDNRTTDTALVGHRVALMLSHGFWHFNAGVRAYYYALAALGWFIHPLLFIAVTVLNTLVLVRRQPFSTTAHDIAEHAEILAAESVASRFPAGEMSSDEPGRSGRG